MMALVRRHVEEGFNLGDWTVCETTLADDYTARYGAEGKANVGRDHYVMVCKMLRKSFPDVAITIEDLVVEGDKIVIRYAERGTLTGRRSSASNRPASATRSRAPRSTALRRSARGVVGRRGHAGLVPPARQVHRIGSQPVMPLNLPDHWLSVSCLVSRASSASLYVFPMC